MHWTKLARERVESLISRFPNEINRTTLEETAIHISENRRGTKVTKYDVAEAFVRLEIEHGHPFVGARLIRTESPVPPDEATQKE